MTIYYRIIYNYLGKISIATLDTNFISPINYNFMYEYDGSYIQSFYCIEDAIDYINSNFDYEDIDEIYLKEQYYYRVAIINNYYTVVELPFNTINGAVNGDVAIVNGGAVNFLCNEDGTLFGKFHFRNDAIDFINDQFCKDQIDPEIITGRNDLLLCIERCVICKQSKEDYFVREICSHCLINLNNQLQNT
jgi:hypothetical protein